MMDRNVDDMIVDLCLLVCFDRWGEIAGMIKRYSLFSNESGSNNFPIDAVSNRRTV